jgi:uncharacterized protein (TIGR00297 family)
LRTWLLAAVLGGAVAAAGYSRRALTLDGAAAAACVGCITLARGGPPAAAAVLTFFSTSSVLSHVGASRKQHGALAQARGAQRDAWQVLANGGFATLSILLGRQRGGGGFLGALSAAGADTWATEIGTRAGGTPRLITTWRAVAPGTSGGITPVGLAASLGGGLGVGLAWACLGGGLPSRSGGWHAIPLTIVAGMCGSLCDSVLGATLQAKYHCPDCDVPIEEAIHSVCGRRAELVQGQSWATNDTINALSTLAGAAVGAGRWSRR